MSQVKFESQLAGKRVAVLSGWDPPLRHYFMTIYLLDEPAEEVDDIVWSTIKAPSDADSLGTQRLKQQLTAMGIDVPVGFWERIERREGNIRYSFAPPNEWRTSEI
jgi:hypothetical protein